MAGMRAKVQPRAGDLVLIEYADTPEPVLAIVRARSQHLGCYHVIHVHDSQPANSNGAPVRRVASRNRVAAALEALVTE